MRKDEARVGVGGGPGGGTSNGEARTGPVDGSKSSFEVWWGGAPVSWVRRQEEVKGHAQIHIAVAEPLAGPV